MPQSSSYQKYKQRLKREAPVQREVARWTDQSVDALQDALDDADWDMFWRSTDDVSELPCCPHISRDELEDLGLHTSLCDWIANFLTDRPQSVWVGNCVSSILNLSTGAPQGCVLSALLYSLHTYDCTATSSSTIIVKFADDTVIMGLISDNDERTYLEEIKHLENLCQENNHLLNISKTKELIMDCSKKQERHYQPVRISGTMVKRVVSGTLEFTFHRTCPGPTTPTPWQRRLVSVFTTSDA
ncbi:hypothetical protein P4O66_022661 [Electrophorus voltai]|uniref:Reverse transcriptase domain-containing protein n=1 Tax=Electrophorus voltai TaxID=2609070 RepID=A0AAD9DZA0_9TELE|nr:hypothetical protein P4O66_022661 [Electrophorus voltai]